MKELTRDVEGRPIDDALAGASNRWRAHCLLELDAGRVVAHHVQQGHVPDAVIASVLGKTVLPLAQSRHRLRTVGLIAGGAVVAGRSSTGETVVSVPLNGSLTGCLWLVGAESVQLDVAELAAAADRVLRAHLAGVDQHVLASTALSECVQRGDPVPCHLVRADRQLRLLGLDVTPADPTALGAALRRCGEPHLGVAACGDALVVLLADTPDPRRSAQRLVAALERQGLWVRGALSAPLSPQARTERAREQVLACLPLTEPGIVSLVEERRSELVLESLRPSLVAAVALVDDPLAKLDHAPPRAVDFRSNLLAWLEAHGDVAAAALQLGVHVNTLRYRVRRALELLETDLSDPNERLEIHLRLRLAPSEHPHRSEVTGTMRVANGHLSQNIKLKVDGGAGLATMRTER